MPNNPVVSFGHVELDAGRETIIHRDGRTVKVSKRASTFLLMLVEADGGFVSYGQILTALWPGQKADETNIRALVHGLRKELGHGAIRVQSGVGYALSPAARESALGEKKRSPLGAPRGPVVAVLPFENLSGSPEQDYLSDGLTDEIIAALGRFRWFPVIARSSTAAYKTALHDVRHLGTMLGATYILTGTMRHHADRIRITSQLADTETGVQIWVQTYDGVRSDVFEFQEEIASSVVAAIEPRLIEAERQRSQLKRPENLTAYDLYLRAMVDFYATSAQQTEAALRYLDEAIRLDPSYAPADALAAERRVYACAQGYIKALHDIRADGERLARKALELDSEDPTVLMLAGHALSYHTRDWDIGLLWLEKALALNPSSVMARCFAGWAKNHAGVPLEAISHFEEAARLSPLDRSGQLYSTGMAVALVMADRHREAVVWGRRAVAEAPSYAAAYRALAAALANDGQQAEARAIGQRAMKLQPEYRISEHAEQFRICPECSLYRDGLLIAGLTP